MIPNRRLLLALLAWSLLGFAASLRPGLMEAWRLAGWGILALAAADFILGLRLPGLAASRRLPGSLAVGEWVEARVFLRNPTGRPLRARVFDHHPASFEQNGLPRSLELPPRSHAEFVYRLRPKLRGPHTFGPVQLRAASPLGLWSRDLRLPAEQLVRVYPNFAAVARYALLATDRRLAQLGILKRRRRGQGMEFHQLREYRQGDSLRQIDWKATARQRKLISRDYQDERDQQVIFLLDCGRRMRTSEGDLSHFDQALNAVLLLAYVALRQGDAVGFSTFAAEDARSAPARKSMATLEALQNALYDLQPSRHASDYLAAAEAFLRTHPKRSLVVLVTNLRDEDDASLLPALELLRSRHLVLLANLRERILDQLLEEPGRDFRDVLLHAAAVDYADRRRRAFEKVRAAGVQSLDVLPEKLAVAMVNRYLEMKAVGAI